MAAVFPLDTTKPWVYNGVTYQYDAEEDRWFVVSTSATDSVVDSISQLGDRLDDLQKDIGYLHFKGNFKYVLEKSEDACNAALAEALTEDLLDQQEAIRIHAECISAIGEPLEAGTYTSIGTLDQDQTQELLISSTDLDGNGLDWENVISTGDYLELAEQNGEDTILYEVVADPVRTGADERIRVKYLRQNSEGDGRFNLYEISEIRVIRQRIGLNIEEADARYVKRPNTVIYKESAPVDGEGDSENGVLRNGELWYDTSNLELYVWYNGSWRRATRPASQDIVVVEMDHKVNTLMEQPTITASDTAPDSPDEGDIWFSTETLRFAFYASGGWVSPDNS